MTARSLRVDLPYTPTPDEQDEGIQTTAEPLAPTLLAAIPAPLASSLAMPTEAVDNVPVVGTTATQTAQTTLLTADAPTHETGETALSLAALTAGHLPQDTKRLAQLLYEMLVQLHTPAGVQDAIDNDTWNLLTRYGVMHGAVNSVEYYSNVGTFVCEAELTQQAGADTLLDTQARLRQLQVQGQLPGLEAGMTWRSGYIRLARLGERPVLLLPAIVESEPTSREAPSDAEG